MVASSSSSSKGLNILKDDNSSSSRTTALFGGARTRRSFKVFSEDDKLKLHVLDFPHVKKKSISVSRAIGQVNARDSKVTALKKMENIRKHDVSFAGRKALADISNVCGNSLGSETCDGSKSRGGKGVREVLSQRASIGPVGTTSRKLLMGQPRTNRIQASATHNLGRVESKDLKPSPVGPSSKLRGERIVNSVGRISARNGLGRTRISLPVLKKVNEVDRGTSDLGKGKVGYTEKGKGKFTFPVKPRVGEKNVPQGSSVTRNLLKNRNSDGSSKVSSRGQSNRDAQASKTFVKPTVKAAITTSRTLASKPKFTTAPKKSAFGSSISSRWKEKSAVSVLPQEAASVIPCEQLGGEDLTSDCNNNYNANTSYRGCDRRKSYTSLLIARSKLIKEHGTVRKQDILPIIYDDCNQLDVAEYIDEIYQYYWVMEAQNHTLKNYMEIQTDITPQMRGILINWLIEVHLKFELMQETLFLMVTLLDQYMSLVCIKKNEMQLVGLTALLLASKYEDFWHPKIMELISISAEWYTRDQMLLMERAILKKIKFRLNTPTPYVFMLRFLKAAQADAKLRNLAFYLIELCLVEYEALKFQPSLLCASAIYVARRTLEINPAWTPLLNKHAHYEEYQLRDCAEMILRIHRGARKGMLKVTLEKYMSGDKCRVAAIKPLDMPLL